MRSGRPRYRVALDEEVRDLLTDTRERRQRPVGVDRKFRQDAVLAGEDLEDAFEFLKRRVRATDDGIQIAAASSQAGAEFVEDDRQTLAFRQARDVSEQIDVDGTVGVLHGHQELPRAFVS